MDKLERKLLWHAIEDAAHQCGYQHQDFVDMVMAGVVCDCYSKYVSTFVSLGLMKIRTDLAERYDGMDWFWKHDSHLAEQPEADRLEKN